MNFKISNSFALPLDFVTQTQAILAKKGSGKSYTASVEAEELLDAKQQVVVIDPTGAWWGLRASADGASSGYPIAVLGGEHADVPLEALAGEVVADAIATEHFSAVIDLSIFRKGESLRFMAAFMETLYRKNRSPLHLFIDEADVVAPQRTFGPDEARVLGATEDIVRRGRIRGIGCTLITQRPQVLNKNVLSQVDMLTALRMSHPKDLGAIREWVAVHGDEAQAKKMLADLPSLPIGEAWIWAPATDIFERVAIRKRHTFDSGRTPKAGERVVVPKVLAHVDHARLGKSIAACAEQAKASDPKALRTRVAELEAQLADNHLREVSVITDADIARLNSAISHAEGMLQTVGTVIVDLKAQLELAGRPIAPPPPSKRQPLPVMPAATGGGRVYPSKHAARRTTDASPSDIAPAHQRILDTIALLGVLGIEPETNTIAAWYGSHPNSKGYRNYLSALRSAGLLEGNHLTAAGAARAAKIAPPTRAQLHERLLAPLAPSVRRVAEIVVAAGSRGTSRDELAAAYGMHSNSKGLGNYVSVLRTRGLISDGWPARATSVWEARR